MAYLLDAGADITARDEHDYTALHLAAYYGRVAVVALLLRRVKRCSEKSSLGENCLTHSVDIFRAGEEAPHAALMYPECVLHVLVDSRNLDDHLQA